jgi:hypothetical protein
MESFAFGGHMQGDEYGGPLICADSNHVFPSDSPSPLPITVPVPADFVARWFLKSTWHNIAVLHESLKLPTIRRQQDIYLASRIHMGQFENVMHLRRLGDWYISDADRLDGINIIHVDSTGVASTTSDDHRVHETPQRHSDPIIKAAAQVTRKDTAARRH